MGQITPQTSTSPWGDLDPHLIHGSLSHLSQPSKQHLNRFSRFRRAHSCNQHTGTDKQTHRQKDHATCDICSNRMCSLKRQCVIAYVTVTGRSRCPWQSFLFSQPQVFPVSSESYPQSVVHYVHREQENSGHCQEKSRYIKNTCAVYCKQHSQQQSNVHNNSNIKKMQ